MPIYKKLKPFDSGWEEANTPGAGRNPILVRKS